MRQHTSKRTNKLWFHSLTPFQVRCRNYLRRVVPFFLMLYELIKLVPYHTVAQAEDWILAAAMPWVWYPVIHVAFELFQRNASVVITPDHIAITSLGKKVKLNRHLHHEWKVIEHDKAEMERDEGHQGVSRYYGRARTFCILYRGKRHDILHVHDASLAAKFMRICEHVDAEMESELTRGKGASLKSVDGFAKQAGGLKK